MKKLLTLTIVLSTLLIAIPAGAVPMTRYVDTAGICGNQTPCDTTIQAAINAANDGDTILVYPGTYDPVVNVLPPGWGGSYPAQGIVVWKANLTIKAVDPDPANTVIQNNLGAWMDWWRIQYITGGVFTSSAPTLSGGFNPGTSASPNALMIVKPGVTIDGFTFHATLPATANDGYNASGVLIGGVAPGDPNSFGADNNTVKNCVFSSVWQAVYIWHSSGNQILNNTVEALGNKAHSWAGITIYDGYSNDQINLDHLSQNNLIQGNTLADKGISVGAYAPTINTDNSGTKIVDNTVHGNIEFYYSTSTGVEISGNTLPGPSAGAIKFNTTDRCASCVVKDNIVGVGNGNGILLNYMTGGSVSGNTVTGRTPTGNGIALLWSSAVAITGNTSTDNTASGIVLVNTSNVTVSDNILLRNAGVAANPGGLTIREGTSSTTVTNNTINNNTQFGVWISTNAGTGNVFHLNNIVANGVGMLNNLATIVNAENNWWGTPTGPYNATSNPGGTGNSANDTSDFNPWISGLKYTGATTFPGPGSVLLQASLVDSAGNGLGSTVPGVSVEFFANGASQGVVTTDANGVAEKTVSLPAGANAIRVVVKGGGLLGDCLAGSEVTASVFGEAPALSLTKAGVLDKTVVAPTDRADAGDKINYTITAKNDGNVTLTGVTVVDPLLGALTCTWPAATGTLLPGESVVCTGSYTLLQADINVGKVDNTATADSDQTPLTPTPNEVPVPQAPALTQTKAGVLDKTVVAPTDRADAGDKINYTITAKNDGNVTLTGVTVVDPLLGALTCTWPAATGTLQPGESVVCTGSYTLLQTDINAGKVDNTATANSDQTPPTVTLNEVPVPKMPLALSLTKTASPTTYSKAGDKITYSYVIKNTGNATLTGPFSVTDNRASVTCTQPTDNALSPDETMTCSASYTIASGDLCAGSVTNKATASGGGATSNQATATVTVAHKALSLTKTASPTTYSQAGDKITYSYVIKNTGNTTLTGQFSVTDNKASVTCTQPADGALSPDETTTCSASYTITSADLRAGSVTNKATASGGGATSNQATATVTAQKPHLTLTKKVAEASFNAAGVTLHYTLVATNDGNVTLTSVSITDAKLGTLSCTPTTQPVTLDPGAKLTCQGTYVTTDADVTAGKVDNTANASGQFGTTLVNAPPASASVPAISQQTGALLPTQTTCQMYKAGPSAWPPMYSSFLYQVKGVSINSVSPDGIFYYNTITAPSERFDLTVSETNVLGWKAMLWQDSRQAILYTSGCRSASGVRVTATGTTTPYTIKFTVTGATRGATYYIGIKYSPQNVVGQKVSTPYPTNTYSFSTSINGVYQIGSAASIQMKKK